MNYEEANISGSTLPAGKRQPRIIRNNGHAEIGVNPMVNDPDTVSFLKVFGKEATYGAGGTRGVVTIKNGTQYEIEASGVVQLEGGFIVEPGAMFAVYPSSF